MNVSAVQFKAIKGDKKASLERLCALARDAGAGTDLLVLPEMAATGYLFESRDAIAPQAEPASGETLAALAPIARDCHCWIVAGFAERAGEQFFNSALVIDPSGALHTYYRKTLLYEADRTWAEPGNTPYPIVDTGHGVFTVGICMDLNDDRFVAWCRSAGADAIAFPTNWLDQGQDIWPYWAWRLKGIPSALVAANTYGEEDGIRFFGSSAVLQRNRILAAAPPAGDGFIRATVALSRELSAVGHPDQFFVRP